MSLRSFFLQPIDDLACGIEVHIANAERRTRAIVRLLVAVAFTWWLYVPVHELLHVLGCVITGGTVSELQIKPLYGGAVLAEVFPFVVCGGEYAGRLTGFDTKGSDLVYLATDAAPFVISVLIGVPLLKSSRRRYAPGVFGVSIVLGLAPLLNLTGDYYEMGSIMTSWVVKLISGDSSAAAVAAIRSDDVFRVVDHLWFQAEAPGLHTIWIKMIVSVLVGVSLSVGVLLALGTYSAGAGVGKVYARVMNRSPATRGRGFEGKS